MTRHNITSKALRHDEHKNLTPSSQVCHTFNVPSLYVLLHKSGPSVSRSQATTVAPSEDVIYHIPAQRTVLTKWTK